MKRIIAFAIIASAFLVSCTNEPAVEVIPDFITDKDVYGINEPVVITNTSVVKNSVAAIYKWEYSGKVFYGKEPEGIRFTDIGEYPVTLTVTANDGFVKNSCTKNIIVEDHNIRPVADFTWNVDVIKGGDTVQFTDASTDEDGTIEAWEWIIGSGTYTEQNPSHTFIESGEVQITLTVTDNAYGRNTITKTVTVEQGKFWLRLDWKQTYDQGGYTRFTSPAMTPDGTSGIYVTSSGGNLVKFNRDGSQAWAYNYASKHNPRFLNKAGTSEVPVVTPSVDADGTVYFAAGFNEPGGDPSGVDNGIMAINPDGTEKWYVYGGQNTRFGWHSPVILKNHILTVQTHAGRTTGQLDDQACAILPKSYTGTRYGTIYATQGSNGGICAYNDKVYVNSAGGSGDQGGTNVGFPIGDKWQLTNNSGSNDEAKYRPLSGKHARSLQPAITSNGEILLLYPDNESDPSKGGTLYCYDDASVVYAAKAAPVCKWNTHIDGYLPITVTSTETAATECAGNGTAIDSDGNIYVSTLTSITALTSNGTVRWTHAPVGVRIECVPAVDNAGCVYYTDSSTGNVVKLDTDGNKLAAIGLNARLTSSVTIANDGMLYVVGLEDGKPTLFALSSNDITGPAEGWSQLSGGPCKRSSVYTENE